MQAVTASQAINESSPTFTSQKFKMKKLKLKSLETGNVEFLSRAQLKNVLGGTSLSTTGGGAKGSYCNCYCGNGTTFSDPISLDGCCDSADSCLGRCQGSVTCDNGSIYALCKGSCQN